MREALKRPVRVAGSSRQLNVKLNDKGDVKSVHAIPEANFTVTKNSDGTFSIYVSPDGIVIDPLDYPKREQIIRSRLQKALENAGAPYSEDEITKAVSDLVGSLEICYEDTTAIVKLPVRTSGYLMSMVKTAYELAWYWMKDAWLNDSTAVQMNRALHGDEDVLLKVYLKEGTIRTFDLEPYQQAECHVVCLHKLPDGSGAIDVQFFDLLGASFVVTADIDQYEIPSEHALVSHSVSRQSEFMHPSFIIETR